MPPATSAPSTRDLYEADFALWAEEQARLMRGGNFGDLDLPRLIEEVDALGAAQREAIETHLTALTTRLLMWKYQPGARLRSWKSDIVEERRRIARLLRTSPSLDPHPAEVFEACHAAARLRAAAETGIDDTLFPASPPFSVAQALDVDFLPREPDLEAYH